MKLASFFRLPVILMGLLLGAMTVPLPLIAADEAKAPAPAAKAAPAAEKADGASVSIRQDRVVHMMAELEEKFIKLASVLEKTEPDQAKRLRTALNKSKQELIQPRMKTIVEKMKAGEFEYTTEVDGKRVTRTIMQDQEDIVNKLKELAQLLTEDPSELDEKLKEMRKLEEFKRDVEKLIKREDNHLKESKKADDPDAATKDLDKQIASVQKLIEKQADVLKKTTVARERGVHELNKITKEQREVRQDTEKTNKEIGGEDAEGKEGTGKPGESGGKPGESGGKPGESGGKPGESGGKPGESGAKPGESGGKPGESGGKPGESGGKPGESGGKPGESGGKPGESGGKPGESGGDQPGQQPLAKAIEAQKAAEKDLGDGKGNNAEKNEKEALAKLNEALEELKKERDRIAKLPPEHGEQMAKAQDKTGEDTGDLAKKMEQHAKEKSESGGSSGGKPGMPGEGGEGGEGGESTPGQEDVQEAQKQMQQAAKKLGQKDPKNAQKPQKDSIDKLKKAREEIEKRLAQLRKEMQEELLAALEARFREMLNKQKPVTLETTSLEGIRKQREWKRAEKLSCAKLGEEERFIGGLADVALQIIKEDGTTVVFPRIVERLRDDLFAVSERLKAEQTDGYTQDLQQEIERTLQDLIEALQRAQEVSEQSGKPGESQSGQPPNPPLVPDSAELKLIKNAQMRVNRLTTSFDKNRPSDLKPTDAKAVKDIARRQEDVHKMAEDIVERGQRQD